MVKAIWLAIGWIALALGAVGAVLPVLPTVPFLLVSVWAFSKSSHRLRDRILNHPKFGPPIRDWMERGVITRSAKLIATAAMTIGVMWSLWLGLPLAIIATQALACTAVAAFLLSRPEV